MYRGVVYLLFSLLMITSPLLISVNATYVPAQTTPIFSGELIPDPYFTQEPYVEIGSFSPEFGYDYSFVGGAGSVDLIWTHTAGHQPIYGSYYPPTCNEYARVSQLFTLDSYETMQAVKISASISIDCTGDFASEDAMDSMWEVKFGITYPYMSEPYTIKTVTDLKDGDSEELTFIFSADEILSYLYGGLTGQYGLSVQLIPTYLFCTTIGDMTPWNDYSGSVILTLDHFSLEVMLEGESRTPPVRTPKYNTTDSENEQTYIMGIESGGYDLLQQLRSDPYSGYGQEFFLCRLQSNHNVLGNQSLYHDDPYISSLGVTNFACSPSRVALIGSYIQYEGGYDVNIQCYDYLGYSIWNSTMNLFYQDIPFFVTFDSSGNLFIFVLSNRIFTQEISNLQIMYSILKVDTLGNRVWNKTVAIKSYTEYMAMSLDLGLPVGFGCNDNGVFIGFSDKFLKLDLNGNEIWTREFSSVAMYVDPQGGIYTFSKEYSTKSELTRWNTNGNKEWIHSLGLDYGSGWIDYPNVAAMTMGTSGPLHLVLRYTNIHYALVLTRVTRTGQVVSDDTLIVGHESGSIYEYLPGITDMAITGDGFVHIVGSRYYYGTPTNPLYPAMGSFLLTYELPAVSTFNPLTIGMVGVAGVLFLGIAYDYFFRRGKVPEPPEVSSISDFEW